MASLRQPQAHGLEMLFPGSEYTDDEVEFIRAMGEWQRRNGVRYPSYTDILNVAFSLGYRRVADPRPVPLKSNGETRVR